MILLSIDNKNLVLKGFVVYGQHNCRSIKISFQFGGCTR